MQRRFAGLLGLVAIAATLIFVGFSPRTTQAAEPLGPPRVVSGFGETTINGLPGYLHITLLVNPGVDAQAALEAAIIAQGGRPTSANFDTLGIHWKQFTADNGAVNVPIAYNSDGDPTATPEDLVGAGWPAVQHAADTWAVDGSAFAFSESLGGPCPSLFPQCGDQTIDLQNTVGWVNLGGRSPENGLILGQSWLGKYVLTGACRILGSGSCKPGTYWEVDMALNSHTDAIWVTVNADDCANGCSDFDVETVYLHELGHGAGLGHSEVEAAVMFARYDGPDRTLDPDDEAGILFLYPEDDGGGGGGPDCSLEKHKNNPNCS